MLAWWRWRLGPVTYAGVLLWSCGGSMLSPWDILFIVCDFVGGRGNRAAARGVAPTAHIIFHDPSISMHARTGGDAVAVIAYGRGSTHAPRQGLCKRVCVRDRLQHMPTSVATQRTRTLVPLLQRQAYHHIQAGGASLTPLGPTPECPPQPWLNHTENIANPASSPEAVCGSSQSPGQSASV